MIISKKILSTLLLFCFTIALVIRVLPIEIEAEQRISQEEFFENEKQLLQQTKEQASGYQEIISQSLSSTEFNADITAYVFTLLIGDLVIFGFDTYLGRVDIDGVEIKGLIYSKSDTVYQTEDGSTNYVSGGFFPFDLSAIDPESEAVIATAFSNDPSIEITQEFLIDSYLDELYQRHLIVLDKYVKYKIESGRVVIDIYNNDYRNYDLTLGKLYDFDTGEIEFIPFDLIPSEPVRYEKITRNIDVDEVKANFAKMIDEQEKLGYKLESFTVANVSIDALNALSGIITQQESLNGYLMEELFSLDLKENEYIHFEKDGSITVKEAPPVPVVKVKTNLDYLIDFGLILGATGFAAICFVFLGPVGSVMCAAIIGATVDYFTQTVVNGKLLSDVNWASVVIAGVITAVTCGINPLKNVPVLAKVAISAIKGGLKEYFTGGSIDDIITATLFGAATSFLPKMTFKCFEGDTLIETESGLIPIKNVVPGTMVYSYNETTKQYEWEKTNALYSNETDQLAILTLSDGSVIRSTTNHPYYVAELNSYLQASELQPQMMLLNSDGKMVSVVDVVIEQLSEPIEVYNLSVSRNHNYFVGETSVLVHNACFNMGVKDVKKIESLNKIVNNAVGEITEAVIIRISKIKINDEKISHYLGKFAIEKVTDPITYMVPFWGEVYFMVKFFKSNFA